MGDFRPDPTFYPSAKLAMAAPREGIGYVALLRTDGAAGDALGVVDLDPGSKTYRQLVHKGELPHIGDELHHYGWNACSSMLCPTVISYKRIGVGAPVSGSTWAPAYASYGGNNRTQMLRVPDGGRVENRVCDGSANPYLAITAQLAAGLDGISRRLDPGEPNEDNLYLLSAQDIASRGIRSLPPTLLHATEALVADDVLREALGKTPDGDYIDYYAGIKSAEFLSWHSVVSDWEIKRYLTLF
jgi:glutamine synthetase